MELPFDEVYLSAEQMAVVEKTTDLRLGGLDRHGMATDMTEGQQTRRERNLAGAMGEVAMRIYLGQDWRLIDEGDPDGGVDIWIEFPKGRRQVGLKTATRVYKEKHIVDYPAAPIRCHFIVRAERFTENGIRFCGYIGAKRFRRRAKQRWYSGQETLLVIHHPEKTGVQELSPIWHLWLASRQGCELA